MQPSWLKTLGSQIQKARTDLGLSQAQLADLIGLSRTMVSHYETGKHMPTFEVMATIATALRAEFEVQGCRISGSDLPKTDQKETSQQLQLEFNRHYTVKATLTIKPVQGSIHISGLADIPKLA
jgi:putative transcriptional regulator